MLDDCLHDACNNAKDNSPTEFPLAIATLCLATTMALPAFAATSAPISVSLRDAAATPIEAVQYRQQTTRQRRQTRQYRSGYRALGQYYYGARDPYPQRVYPNAWSGSWGHCASGSGADSAYPSWDTCSGLKPPPLPANANLRCPLIGGPLVGTADIRQQLPDL